MTAQKCLLRTVVSCIEDVPVIHGTKLMIKIEFLKYKKKNHELKKYTGSNLSNRFLIFVVRSLSLVIENMPYEYIFLAQRESRM